MNEGHRRVESFKKEDIFVRGKHATGMIHRGKNDGKPWEKDTSPPGWILTVGGEKRPWDRRSMGEGGRGPGRANLNPPGGRRQLAKKRLQTTWGERTRRHLKGGPLGGSLLQCQGKSAVSVFCPGGGGRGSPKYQGLLKGGEFCLTRSSGRKKRGVHKIWRETAGKNPGQAGPEKGKPRTKRQGYGEEPGNAHFRFGNGKTPKIQTPDLGSGGGGGGCFTDQGGKKGT